MVKAINKKRADRASKRMLKIKSKAPNLKDVQKRMGGRFPQWKKLEGKADNYKTLAAVLDDFTYVEEKHEKLAEAWLKKAARSKH